MNDLFFDDFMGDFLGFGKPMHLVFNTNGTKDMMPSCWKKTDKGYKCICRSVGVAPSDLKVTLEDYGIHVEGETKINEKDKYSTKYDLPIIQDILDNIKNVKYKSENGITTIYIEIDRPEKKKINIEQIK